MSPDYADNVKFADEWLAAQPGTDGALAMAMGHVILKEFFVDRQVPYFTEYVKQYTDLPFLVRLEQRGGSYFAGQVPHRLRPRRRAGRRARRVQDGAARLGDRPAGRAERLARLPLRRGGRRRVEPRPRRGRPAALRCRRRRGARRGAAAALRRARRLGGGAAARRPGPPGRRPPGDDGLRPDAGAVRRRPRTACPAPGPPGTTTPPSRTRRPGRRPSPASRRTRPSGSAGSSPRTPRSRAAGR